MHSRSTKHRAQWALTFVWWVIFVCLSQNAGLFHVCPLKTDAVPGLSQQTPQANESTASGDCELTEHMLSSSTFNWDNITLSLFVLVLAFVGFLLLAFWSALPANARYRMADQSCPSAGKKPSTGNRQTFWLMAAARHWQMWHFLSRPSL
ncbi:hypothetical protein [Grimontia hollisae]|uniref:hypothetical protein n=1 Tax=Grimontia hollisae TaxID=673 RepID=UPI00165D8FAC|nr:hypothetical protein [Grimontia hollisae]